MRMVGSLDPGSSFGDLVPGFAEHIGQGVLADSGHAIVDSQDRDAVHAALQSIRAHLVARRPQWLELQEAERLEGADQEVGRVKEYRAPWRPPPPGSSTLLGLGRPACENAR